MDSVRDMYVGIRLRDEATRDLERIDRKMDEIHVGFERIGLEADEAAIGFNRMGISGSRAMDGLDDAIEDLKDEISTLSMHIRALSLSFSQAFERMEDDVEDVEDEVEDLGKQIDWTTAKVGLLGGTLTAVFAGAVAASAPLLAGMGALAASLGAAAIGAAAFGAVAVGALTDIFEAQKEVTKLQEKIENADTAKERIEAQKELAALYAEMSQEQRNALTSLQAFKSFWSGFVKQFEKPVFQMFANGLQGLQGLLTRLQPAIGNVANVFVELTAQFNQSLDSPSMKRFFEWLETNAAESLYHFAQIFGNTFLGFTNMFSAFAPLGASVEEWLVRITQRFEDWAAGLSQSTAFQNFVNYAKANGPLLSSLFGNVINIISGLAQAFAPLGSDILKALMGITDFIADMTPSFSGLGAALSGIIGGLTPLFQQLAPSIAQGFTYLMNTLKGLQPQFQAFFQNLGVIIQFLLPVIKSTFMGIVTGIKGALNIIFGVVKVFASLIQGDFRAAWEGVKQIFTGAIQLVVGLVTVGFIGRIGSLFKLFGSKVASVFSSLASKMGSAMSAAKNKVVSFFTPLNNFISKTKSAWEKLVNAFKNFKMPKIGLPKWMGGKGLIQVPGHATGLSRVPYDNYLMRAHKDETILRADQAESLEQAGILDRSGYTPKVNLPTDSSVSSAVFQHRLGEPTTGPRGASINFAPNVNIYVTAQDVQGAGNLEAALNRKLDELFQMLLDIYPAEVVR